MKKNILCSLIFCLFIPYLFAKDSQIKCPTLNELNQILQSEVDGLLTIRDDLDLLLNGKKTSLIPSVLLMVDLNDKEAISRKLQDLHTELYDKETSINYSHIYSHCITEKNNKLLNFINQIKNLEIDILQKKISFLEGPDAIKENLILAQEQMSQNEEVLKNLQSKKDDAQKRADDAALALKAAENIAQKTQDFGQREIELQKALLEKFRKDLADLNLNLTIMQEEETKNAHKQTEVLSGYTSLISHINTASLVEIKEAYLTVIPIWRELTDSLLSNFINLKRDSIIPDGPKLPKNLLDDISENQDILVLKTNYQHALGEKQELINLLRRNEKEKQHNQYKLLILAAKLRSELIKKLSQENDAHIFTFTNNYFLDLFREIRMIPYRPLVFLKDQAFELKRLKSLGIEGFLTIFHRIFLLLLFFITPFIAYKILRQGSKYLEKVKNWLRHDKSEFKWAMNLALWINRLNPYLPWIMMLIATKLSKTIVQNGDLEELIEILPYFNYYFYYQIFKLLVGEIVLAITVHIPQSHLASKKITSRSKQTTKILGRFFLISAYILHATQTIARTGLFYHLLLSTLFIITPIIFAIAAYWWREELSNATTDILKFKFAEKLKFLCLLPRWSFIACLPIAILLICTLMFKKIYQELVQYESAKRVSAQLFKRNLETMAKKKISITKQNIDLDSEYLNFFNLNLASDSRFYVETKNKYLSTIYDEIKKWNQEEHDEHSLAICAEAGSGKSSILNALAHKLEKDIKVIFLKLSNKITTKEQFLSFLTQGSLLDFSNGIESLLKLDKQEIKTVIIIDEAQNLFIGKKDGFEAFHLLLTLINADTKNFFWCATFGKFAWNYLSAVTKNANYFRKTVFLEKFNDKEIRELIFKRHLESKFSLEFDPIIFATSNNNESTGITYIEDRFFELLWEQSKGNPKVAISLWLSSLRKKSNNSLVVGPPTSLPRNILDRMTDDELFVIAAIIRHDDLSKEEIKEVTNLQNSVIQNSLRIGLERGFIITNKQQYMIHPLWQHSIIQGLFRKNFIYE